MSKRLNKHQQICQYPNCRIFGLSPLPVQNPCSKTMTVWFIVPLWKSGGYTGFALSFCHSVILWFLSFRHSVTFQMKIFCHFFFSGTVRPRRLKFGTHMDNGRVYRVYRNQAVVLICPFISSFFFLSNFQTLKIFFTLFSGTVTHRRLKLGTDMDNGWVYRVYWNQAAAAYSSLCFFIFLSLQFSDITNFRHTFLRNCEARRLKLGIHVDNGWMNRVYRNQLLLLIHLIYFFIFLSLQFLNIKIFCHTFLRKCEA